MSEIDQLPDPMVEQVGLPEQEEFYRPPARFGHVPVPRTPLGWDPKNRGFRNHYPFINLPTQIVDRVRFGAPELEANRLIWGDNLHVMRQLPSESIDLIYIDPPFFSNRVYNVIWGDEHEERSFSDIWEGGLDGYLIWLNARLYEMKRLLKASGSIYVHCDWHASHYIKVEMDKIFGYENLMNELVWCYRGGGVPKDRFARKHDIILWYKKGANCKFNVDAVRLPYSGESMERLTYTARAFRDSGVYDSYRPNKQGKHPEDHLHIQPIMPSEKVERIGYPTQKPLELLQLLLEAASDPGDLVADFFVGGGSFASAAAGARSVRTAEGRPAIVSRPEISRRWIACDQSRVAVAVTTERLKYAAAQREIGGAAVPDFTIEHWGIYEARRLSKAPPEQFRHFVLACYDARIPSVVQDIHGYKGQRARIPVWVGAPALTARVTATDVNDFAQAIFRLPRYRGDEGLRDGVMLAWGFAPDAVRAAEELRQREDLSLAFVRLEQVPIDSPAFRSHIESKSTERGDYSQFLTFVQPPEVSVAWRRLRPLHYEFDAGDTQPYNPGASIINLQWDFDYRPPTFRAARGEWFRRRKGKSAGPVLDAQHVFPRSGVFTVACKVQDDKGGEGTWTGRIQVE